MRLQEFTKYFIDGIKKLIAKNIITVFPISALRLAGATIGQNVHIGPHVYVDIDYASYLTIEDDVVVSPKVAITLHDSSLNNVLRDDLLIGHIILRKNCYIGIGSIILPGTIVEENTIVGGGSIIKGLLKSNSVYYGNPVKYGCNLDEIQKKWNERKNSHNPMIHYIKQNKWYEKK